MAETVTRKRELGLQARQRLDTAAQMMLAPRAAGGLSKVIQAREGEGWYEAVLRVLNTEISQAERDRLRELVDWVQDYGFDDDPARPEASRSPLAKLTPRRQLDAAAPVMAPAPVVEAAVDAGLSEDDLPMIDIDPPDFDDEAELMALASVEACRS